MRKSKSKYSLPKSLLRSPMTLSLCPWRWSAKEGPTMFQRSSTSPNKPSQLPLLPLRPISKNQLSPLHCPLKHNLPKDNPNQSRRTHSHSNHPCPSSLLWRYNSPNSPILTLISSINPRLSPLYRSSQKRPFLRSRTSLRPRSKLPQSKCTTRLSIISRSNNPSHSKNRSSMNRTYQRV